MTGGFAVVLAILVVTFLASVNGASRLADLDAAVGRARGVLEEIAATRTVLGEGEYARRGYLLTHENAFLELYLAAMKDVDAHLDRLRELTTDDPGQRRRVAVIGPLAARQLTLVTEAIASPSGRPRDVARDVAAEPLPDDGAVVTEQIRGLVAELEDRARAHLREHESDANTRTVKVIRGFGAVALVALLLLGAAYYALDRDAAVHAAILEELRMYSRSATPTAGAEPAETAGSEATGGEHAASD
ncbi:MAG: CHASE3 domain-containing protein [Deltaproteobacteria bacterium]|nr:CHASE3 domain-containing protein [Deltaproteobacteria bacterium]